MEEKNLEFLKKALGQKCACYVLISCQEPNKDGKMEVALNYEGDEDLASYLLESAQQVFIKKKEESLEA